MPYSHPALNNVSGAWRIAGLFVGISFGWGAGDTALQAYIQSTTLSHSGPQEPATPGLAQIEHHDADVSTLSAMMSFLYSSHVVLFSIINPQLGNYVDAMYNAGRPIQDALVNVRSPLLPPSDHARSPACT